LAPRETDLRVHPVLETPFAHLRDLLVAIYPQTWLPYRYLWSSLRSCVDSVEAFTSIAEQQGRLKREPRIMILQAEKDQIVPDRVRERLGRVGEEVGLRTDWAVVGGATYQDVMMRMVGKQAVTKFVTEVMNEEEGC
jgi:uncharacterized protein